MKAPNMFELIFNAPLIGVRKRWPNVLHAVEMEGLPIKTWPKGKAVSVCGITGLRLLGREDGSATLWPPRVKGMPDGVTRCRDCHEATGRLRPRSEYRAKVPA